MIPINFSEDLRKSNIFLAVASCEFDNFVIMQKQYDLSFKTNEIKKQIKNIYNLENIKEDPTIKLYRSFYWEKLHLDPTKIRPASEALIRRILGNKDLPKISPFVDAYNWGSVASLIPMGAYDIDKIKLPIMIRLSIKGEYFVPIAQEKKEIPENLLITADAKQILCQYPYRDSQNTMITEKTKKILLLSYGIQGISKEKLFQSLDLVKEILKFLKIQGCIEYSASNYNYFQSFE